VIPLRLAALAPEVAEPLAPGTCAPDLGRPFGAARSVEGG